MLSTEAEPPSPCIGICRLEGALCVGCGRLIGEVIEWPAATGERKLIIRDEAAKRLAIIKTHSAEQG